MKYYKDKQSGEVFGYDPDQKDLIAKAKSNPNMEDITSSWPPKSNVAPDKAGEIRGERNLLLMNSDWTQVADAPVDQAAWAEYRQELRDITEQEGFPDNVIWPVRPE
jgi:hypothetical protein